MTATTILIVGGYGSFGGRLARSLAEQRGLTLVIAGRSRRRAEAFCSSISGPAARLIAIAFDRDGDVVAQLRSIAPDVVIDASGPFQNYSGDIYRLVKAAIGLRIHYLDLADAAAFVSGISKYDEEARRAGVVVLSGVSTFPALTAAVVRHLATDMARVELITAGIAPSPFAEIGTNVISAVASYAGRPIAMLADGCRVRRAALIDAAPFTVAPPGRLPLPRIRFQLVEAPDLEILPGLWPDLRTIWIGVGLHPALRRYGMTAVAYLVRWGLLRSLSPLTGLLHRAMKRLAFGEHRGGMFVAVRGSGGQNGTVERSWHLVAEANDGPYIPAMAAEAIIRRMRNGPPPVPGARAAAGELDLSDFVPLFARRRIATGVRYGLARETPLYRRLLGDAFAQMPQPWQAMHDVEGELAASGLARVERGSGLLARAIAWLVGFPAVGEDIPVRVTLRRERDAEVWRRDFAGRSFASIQEEGRGRWERLLCERFGPLTFAAALVIDDNRLNWVLRGWSIFAIPLPLALAPRASACEFVAEGRFHFDVAISHPLAGAIVRYRGWLTPIG